MKKATKLICTLALTAAVTGTGGIITAFADGDAAYYVCYSTENYAVRNANKTSEKDGEFYLYNVTLNSLVDFFVTDGAGRRWYASDGDEMSVSENSNFSYDIKFSPNKIYSEEGGEWEATDCNITYRFYTPAEYSVTVGGEELKLTYNPYRKDYEEYYISSQSLAAGTTVSYGGETHTIEHDGFYRITFTNGARKGGNDYAYNKDGVYGTGDDFVYKIHIEDAPQYYLLPDGESEYIPLTRYENNVAANEYRSEEFFNAERDFSYRYRIFEKEVSGAYRLVDDDNDEDTAISKITVPDVGWFNFCFIDGGEVFNTYCAHSKRKFGGYYAVGDFNGYCFDSNGFVDTDEKFRFKEVEEDDEDYDKDYKQYYLNLTVTDKSLKENDVEFYISDGENSYKNGTEYIKMSRAGEYKILFSDEQFYGNGRRYRYVLLSDETAYREIEIGTAQEFNAFAANCSKSADYSKNLSVYLTADIDFANTPFVSIGEFSGKFYGGYHTLKNITVTDGAPAVVQVLKRDGLFERVNIKNISLDDKDADYAGVVGKNYGTVANISVYGSVTGNNYVGAVVAYNGRSAENEGTGSTDTNELYRYGVIENCKNYAEVSGTVHCGGVCGFNAGEIIFCENNAKISCRKQSSSSTPFNLGGIAGYSAGKITACENNGEVAGGSEALYVGGVSGLCAGEVYYSFNTAKVSGRKYTGGILGYYGKLSSDGDNNDFFGGLTYEEIYNKYFGNEGGDFEQVSGVNQIVKYCANFGEISSVSYAGGVVGNADAERLNLTCCENEGSVSVTAGSYAGGIAGRFNGANLESCVAGGKISAKGLNAGNYVGGIAGYGNNVTVCSSVCELVGSDYIGGIVGYNQKGLSSCWSSVIIIASSGAENVGNVAGFTEALNEAADNFADGFADNFFVENAVVIYGGVGGRSYGVNYGFAATPVESDKLAFKGVVSPYLSNAFNAGAKWQGTAIVSYPVPRYLTEADDCDEFGDDEEFKKFFAKYGDKFSATALKNSQVLYTVTFLEWNEDNGSLYDDGVLQTDNFDVIKSVRLPLGALAEVPEFKWAYISGDRFVYDGDEASYFVSFPAAEAVSGNALIYARYREIVKTIATEDEKVLVEGVFDIDTRVELVSSVNGYSLKFILNGEEVQIGSVKVKFLTVENGGKAEIFSPDGTKTEASELSGKYLAFTYSDGDYFKVIDDEGSLGLPAWAWAIIGGVIGAVIVAASLLTPFFIKKSKNKKKEKTEQTAESVEEN